MTDTSVVSDLLARALLGDENAENDLQLLTQSGDITLEVTATAALRELQVRQFAGPALVRAGGAAIQTGAVTDPRLALRALNGVFVVGLILGLGFLLLAARRRR